MKENVRCVDGPCKSSQLQRGYNWQGSDCQLKGEDGKLHPHREIAKDWNDDTGEEIRVVEYCGPGDLPANAIHTPDKGPDS